MKVNTQTGLIQHREANMRDACISVHLVVGMSATLTKGETTSVNYVRYSFHCFYVVRTRMTAFCLYYVSRLMTSIVPSLR